MSASSIRADPETEDVEASSAESKGAALRTIVRHRRIIGLELRLLAVVAVLAIITGLGQAAALLVVVRAATALTADTELISGEVGPFSASDLTVGQLIWIGVVVLLILFVAEVALIFTQTALQTRSMRTGRRRILRVYSRASYAEQTALARGDIQTVMAGHTVQASIVCGQIATGVVSTFNFCALVASAIVLSAEAALLVVGGVMAMLAILRPLLLMTRRVAQVRIRAQRQYGKSLIERLELVREVRAFGVDEASVTQVRGLIDVVAKSSRKQQIYNRLAGAFYRIGTLGMVLAMLAFIEGRNLQNLAALTGALLMLLRSMSYGQGAQRAYQSINETIPSVVELVEETERLERSTQIDIGTAEPPTIGSITFEGVHFAYPGDEGPVLHGIDFEVETGDFVAIVGPSGAGKSTIMALLLRLWAPDRGTVSANGVDIYTIEGRWWTRKVAYVPQDSKLQDGTVADAIRFHRDWVTDDDIRRAAAMAHVADEIESWVDGYDTPVGPLGEQLSGGQRQRVAIARALAGQPEVLLLDEPTSALDPASERLISETLDALRGRMTIVAIAHRFGTVQRANRVVHVRDGRIIPHEGDDREEIRRILEA